MIRVCFVGDDVSPPWNNASSILTRRMIEAVSVKARCSLATRIAEEKWEPSLSGLDRINYVHVTGRPSIDAMRLSIATRSEVDVLHLVGTNALFFSPTSKLLGSRAKIIRHVFTPYDIRDRAIGPIRRVANKLFIDSYAFTTPQMGEWKTELSPGTRRYLIRPPIDCSIYRPNDTSNSAHDDQTILYMGPLMKTRFPYEIVLRALKSVINHGHNRASLVILASARRTSQELAEKVSGYANQLSIGDRVHVERIDLTETERIEWYNKADVVIFPYVGPNPEKLADPPLGILEAMASGGLVLSTDVLSVQEVLADNINGFIIPDLNVQALAKHMERALEASGDRRIRRRARERIMGGFDYPVVADMAIKAYQDLLS